MPRPRYKRENRTPAQPLQLFIEPNPDSELARNIEEAAQRVADRITQHTGRDADVWDTNGRTL